VASSEIARAPAEPRAAPQPAARPRAAPQPAAPQPSAPAPSDPPPNRRFLIFGVTAIALFMASIDQTIVSTALGTLQHDLHAAINWVSWTITIYALGQIVAMPVAGALSDIYGRKRLFLGAVVLFTVASLCCGLSTNIYELVILRLLQALGGGAFMPSATGIVSDQFGADRDRAIGMFTSIFPIGAIVGPILGGVFVTYWSWRGIFLVNVPLGAVLLILAAFVIPGSDRKRQQRLDVKGVAELGAGLLGIMLAIGSLGSIGSLTSRKALLAAVPLLAGLAALVAFIRHCGRAEHPFVDVKLFRERSFAVMNVINFFNGAAVIGFASLVPFYAEERFGLKALPAGTLLTMRAVGMLAVAALATFALRRTGYRPPMIVGFALTAVGTALLAFPASGVSPYAWLALAAGVTGIGTGVSLPASNNATLQLAPARAASISGLRGMFRQAGGITGISIASALVARSSHPGLTQAAMFTVLAVIMVLLIPLTFLVPEHRGTW
jgi:EmrB/QacA subfamily drug resistance transporter